MTRQRGTGKALSGRGGRGASKQPARLALLPTESGDRVRPRLFEDVVRQIRVEIAGGRLRPGQRLPTETEMAAELRVSRGSVREAIRVLEMLALVTVKRGRLGGVFTTPNCQEVAQASFTSLLPLQQTSVKDSFEFRRIVEPQAAALAAIRATERDREMLRAALQRTEDRTGPRETFGQHARLFHQAIVAASRNSCIETFFTPFLLSREMSFSTAHKEPVQRSLTHFFHAKIFEAIDTRNADDARAWMDAHISQMEGDLVEAEGMQQDREEGERPGAEPSRRTSRKNSQTESPQ
jgi:GntR family transcriptional repressor for pyruvate dehydrogenase complex